jgi:hypothetical protein
MPSKSKAPGGKQISVKAARAQNKNSGAAAEYVTEVSSQPRNIAEESNQSDLRLGISTTFLCRVTKLLGSGRMQVISQTGKEMQMTLRGNLKCSAGAARNPGNPLALTPGSYVLADDQIIAVLSRSQVADIKDLVFSIKGFFDKGDTAEEGCGVEFAEEEEPDVDAI